MDPDEHFVEMQRISRRAFVLGVAVVIVVTLAFWLLGVVLVDQAFSFSLIQAM